jgi:riboflavin synthase
MFTGLVAGMGRVLSVQSRGTGKVFWIESPFETLALGESIACDGVCLTVEASRPTGQGDHFQATAGKETLLCTNWALRGIGHTPHLERALQLSDRLGGHLVSGHVDGIALVERITPYEGWIRIQLKLPPELCRYVAKKGSICLDGISLTVNEVEGQSFAVGIIPHTATITRIKDWKPGEPINVEVDLVARYLERLGQETSGGVSRDTLKKAGFL